MRISANPIDVLKTQEAFAKKYKTSRVSRDRFGLPIVKLAHSAIGRHGPPTEELPGIRKCLIELAGEVTWRSYIWVVPIPPRHSPFSRGPFGEHWQPEKLSLLVDSLIVTVLAHQSSLWEFHTNLAPILLSDLTNGFERMCDWIERGVPVDAEENDLIVPIDKELVDSRLVMDGSS